MAAEREPGLGFSGFNERPPTMPENQEEVMAGELRRPTSTPAAGDRTPAAGDRTPANGIWIGEPVSD